MDIELFRDFIDYLDNKEIIYTIDNLLIDADNIINLNKKKYKLLSFSSIQEILEDKIKLNDWKSRVSDKTPSYKSFIYTWTVRDVEKRKLAKSEKLNYLEIFSCNIDKVIESFEDYLTKDDKYAVYTFDKKK